MKYPDTIRYCPVCERITRFELNKAVNHSECKNCGSRKGNIKIDTLTHINHRVILKV